MAAAPKCCELVSVARGRSCQGEVRQNDAGQSQGDSGQCAGTKDESAQEEGGQDGTNESTQEVAGRRESSKGLTLGCS
jgi:hypothetical protein